MNKKQPRLIHIHADSEILTVHEIVEEKKAVKRLEQIRDGFLELNERPEYYRRFPNAKLTVRTVLINPTLL